MHEVTRAPIKEACIVVYIVKRVWEITLACQNKSQFLVQSQEIRKYIVNMIIFYLPLNFDFVLILRINTDRGSIFLQHGG
jgi:hypothetical protein